MRYMKMHKHDPEAVGYAGVVMGVFILVLGLATQDGWTQILGAVAFFGGLFILRDK